MGEGMIGTAIIIWLADGKLKQRTFDDQLKWATELKRIRNTVPPNKILTFAIDWDNDTVHTFDGTGYVETTLGP